MNFIDFVREAAIPKEHIDRFLDPNIPTWGRFDPVCGYALGNYMPRDGIDGSLTISTTVADGARRPAIYADRARRINTYGNSFTQCHQVSDHETWQEYLAAHLGEPLGNHGVGGYGVYQAYRRMLRVEQSPAGAQYAVLYLWDDDHVRSVMRCRHIAIHRWWGTAEMFHGNPWANIEMDLASGKFIERENPLPTPQSLYKMCDPDFLVEQFGDDLMVQMVAFVVGHVDEVDVAALSRLSVALGRPPLDRKADLRLRIDALHHDYGFAATFHIIERALDFAKAHNKQLLLVLFTPTAVRQLIATGKRYDQPVVNWIRERQLRHFDMTPVHVEDYRAFNLPLEDYLKRYYVGGRGHYSPAGNHFFAHAIRTTIVEWLDPKPITYRAENQARIDFTGYMKV